MTQAIESADGRAHGERGERAQRIYLARLKKLVEATPPLHRLHTLAERAQAAARIAQQVFDADEAFVGTMPSLAVVARGGSVRGLTAADADFAALLDGVRTGTVTGVTTSLVGDRIVHAVALAANDKVFGVLAIRVPRGAPFAELTESLLVQLGELVAVAIENVRLFEAAQHAAALRDDVIAVVSHDLRSPLNSFTLGLDLIRRGDPDQQERICDRMQRAVSSMNKLIEELLDVSSVERGELALQIQPTPVSMLFEELTALQSTLAQHAGVRLRIKAHAECRVHGDPKRLLKALSTLTANAIKQTPPGGEVSVETAANDETNEIVFTICDSSPAELDAKRAFDRQPRGPGARVTGLGVYVVKAIIEAHGGRIWAEAAPERGRRFCIALRRS